ncbi:hypothetical protein HK096_002633 [Nowakowskiella sp. JEL0078]|nr:hypothetical protein HK096_002633 [Nowakowskiella sp. JEL0078]
MWYPYSYEQIERSLDSLERKVDESKVLFRRELITQSIEVLNPDGVKRGLYRTDTLGCNLNRIFSDPSETQHPAIFAVHRQLQDLQNEINALSLVRREGAMQFKDSKDGGASKETSGRVIALREFGIRRALTIEVNNHCSRHDGRTVARLRKADEINNVMDNNVFSVAWEGLLVWQLIRIGTSLGEALLDYSDNILRRVDDGFEEMSDVTRWAQDKTRKLWQKERFMGRKSKTLNKINDIKALYDVDTVPVFEIVEALLYPKLS